MACLPFQPLPFQRSTEGTTHTLLKAASRTLYPESGYRSQGRGIRERDMGCGVQDGLYRANALNFFLKTPFI